MFSILFDDRLLFRYDDEINDAMRRKIEEEMREKIKNYDPGFLQAFVENKGFFREQIEKDRPFLNTGADIDVLPHYTAFDSKEFDGKRKARVVFGCDKDDLRHDYQDRLWQWDSSKYDHAIQEANRKFPKKGNYRHGHTQEKWEYFLKIYKEADNISLRFIESGIQSFSGYPWALFGYKIISHQELRQTKDKLIKKGLKGIDRFTTTELDILYDISKAGVDVSEVTPDNKGEKLTELYFEKRLRERVGVITYNFKTGFEPSIVLQRGVDYRDIPYPYIVYIHCKSQVFRRAVESGITPIDLHNKSLYEIYDLIDKNSSDT